MPDSSRMESIVRRIAARYGDDPRQLLQMLRAVQATWSWIPPHAIALLAAHLQVPPGEVRGIVEFYSFLHLAPRGRYDIYFSDNITDRHLGSRTLAERLCALLGVPPGRPRGDGVVTVDFSSCTGMSDQAPAALVNGMPLTDLDAARIDEMAELIQAGVALEAWPREWFSVRENVRRAGSIFGTPVADGTAIRQFRLHGADSLLAELDRSGLRGRGGSGFGTARKWKSCRESGELERYVICNADEGEPATFKDRVLLTRLADSLFEGMTLAGLIVGSQRGFLYLRAEYQYLLPHLEGVLARRRQLGLLGNDVQRTGLAFDIEICLGAGAYVCGEESALIESLEGRRGQVRVRPPFPTVRGYAQKPTIVNNVQTFVQAAQIAVNGSDWFTAHGSTQSPGTTLVSIAGDVERPGVYEYPFGTFVGDALADAGVRDVQAVQVGGPSGRLISPSEFGRRIAFEDLGGSGSLMVFDTSRDLIAVAQNFIHFFQHESCGFCTPCRVGTTVLRDLVDKVAAGRATSADLAEIEATGEVTRKLSHCGLGQTAPRSLLDSLARFRPAYEARLASQSDDPGFDLDAELSDARRIRGNAVAESRRE